MKEKQSIEYHLREIFRLIGRIAGQELATTNAAATPRRAKAPRKAKRPVGRPKKAQRELSMTPSAIRMRAIRAAAAAKAGARPKKDSGGDPAEGVF